VTAPLRILALLEASSISGTAKAVLEMAYEARADLSGGPGMSVSVASFLRGNQPAENVLTQALGAAGIPYSFIREQGRFDSSVIPQIRNLIRAYDPQVVWTNSVKSHFLVKKSGIQKKCRWAAFHHGYTSTDLKMRLYNQLDRLTLRKADRVLTVCQPFADQLKRRGVTPKRLRVQHMPIRPFVNTLEDGEQLREELHIHPEAKVILSVGRLSREKGHIDLIRAFAKLRNELKDDRLRLVMVGDGPERTSLEQESAHLDIGTQVIFAGHRDDAKRFYGIATVFALPSYTEGTPNVLLEAMAASVLVVATAVGGIPELATDSRNALLVPPGNAGELAAALQKAIQSNALRNELTEAAKAVVIEHSPRAYFANMREVFLEMVADR